MKHSKETIRALLVRSDLAVERAILAIFARQTETEQHAEVTVACNGQGFSAFHAKPGTYYAKWLLSGRHLTGQHLARARKLSLHYVGQLLLIAQEKQS